MKQKFLSNPRFVDELSIKPTFIPQFQQFPFNEIEQYLASSLFNSFDNRIFPWNLTFLSLERGKREIEGAEIPSIDWSNFKIVRTSLRDGRNKCVLWMASWICIHSCYKSGGGEMVLNAISGTSLPLPGNLDCDPRLYPDYRKSSCSIEGVYDVSIVETVLNVLKYDKNWKGKGYIIIDGSEIYGWMCIRKFSTNNEWRKEANVWKEMFLFFHIFLLSRDRKEFWFLYDRFHFYD